MMLNLGEPAKLKTKKIVFEDAYEVRDPGSLEQLKELSAKRKYIEESINNSSSITEAIAREISGGLTSHCEQELQKLEQYIPLLENLVHLIDLFTTTTDHSYRINRWTANLKIRWSSSLCSSSFFNNLTGPKFFQIDDVRFEIGMILFLYGAILRDWASEILLLDLVRSATIFRRAAGVYRYLSQEVLPRLSSVSERPPESFSEISSVMSLICLAEAQAVTIKKAEEKGNTASLLSKLHYGVVQFLDEAMIILQSYIKENKDISARFLDFIFWCRDLHELRSYKYLARSMKDDDGNLGGAIGILRNALNKRQTKVPGDDLWRQVLISEINESVELLRKYEHENEFVWHEKVLDFDQLPVPQGKKIVNSISYNPERWERSLSFKI
ncbi:BRO1 domain-containing protein BROX [Impatiens glandulifera]|uniref:BRO1 domain-containing protein BROX n=1 Tax=Impatiens glandulifera TaxID=253017 RepID=UPI001FB17C34|nr:BRO1 domain-containing protein BROX [Impatiens glandulifera]